MCRSTTRIDEYLKSILLEGYIFGAKPDILNDPYETKLCMTMDGVDVGSYIKYLFEKIKVGSGLSPSNRLKEMNSTKRRLKSDPANYLGEVETNINNHSLKYGKIVSLSRDGNNPLLWSLYADSHKGVCIEFESDSGLFSLAEPVDYVNSYPVVPMDWRLVGSDNLWKLSILTKANFWAYEQESRLAMMADEKGQSIIDQVLLKAGWPKANRRDNPNGSEYYFGRDKIKSVVLGARVSKDNENKVRKLIESSDIKLFQAKICRGSYELKYTEI